MSKYQINKEFALISHFTPPIKNAKTAGRIGSLMKPLRWIWHDKEVKVSKKIIKSFDEKEIELLIFEPRNLINCDSCLIYYHGGGFFFGGAGYHYKLAKEYATKVPCKVIFVQYR